MTTEKPSSNLRVFSGPNSICGQSHALVQGLRHHGIEAQSVVLSQGENGNRYKYETDSNIQIEGSRTKTVSNYLSSSINKFDIFHFHSSSFLHATPWPSVPTALDIAALKLAGKKVYFHFRGSEVRLRGTQLEKNKFNYVESAPHAFLRLDSDKNAFIEYVKSICDGVFVVDREVYEYVQGGKILPIMLDLEEWDYVGLVNTEIPLIIHAPSDKDIKGTTDILAAVETLKAEGLKFEFTLVENLSIQEARKLYERADIIIDQLKMGWFGTLTVEAMALGKPVICYLREDLIDSNEEIPIANANPSNIVQVLRRLIEDKNQRNKLSYLGRDYAIEHHCHIKSSLIALNEYDTQRTLGSEIISPIINYFETLEQTKNSSVQEKLMQQRTRLNEIHAKNIEKIKLDVSRIKSSFAFKLAKKLKLL